MPQFYERAVMTNAGVSLLARAMSEGVSVEFTAMVVGNGSYTPAEKQPSALRERNALKSLQVSYTPSAVIRDSDNSVRVSALLTNVDPETEEAIVTSGFYINEIGIMAQPSDHAINPILFSISVTAATQGDYMPAYTGDNPAQIVQGYVTAISNQAEITVDLPVAAFALATDLQYWANNAIYGGSTSLTAVSGPNYVAFDEVQSMTEAQKAQARANIGAASPSDIPTGAVRYDAAQTLSTAEKAQARANIGAATVSYTITYDDNTTETISNLES